MSVRRRVLYVLCFVTLALVAAVTVDRLVAPSIAPLLVLVVVVATLAGAAGLAHRRAWPAALVLLPLGAYLVARLAVPLPPEVDGFGGQLGFYADQIRSAAEVYARRKTPLDLGRAPEVMLLMALLVYAATGLAAFLALSLRRVLPALAVLMVLIGFAFTVDDAERVVWLPVAFLLLAGGLLMLSRSLERRRWRPGDLLAGGATALAAAVLAFSLLGVTSVSASKPWWDWRAWGQSPGTQSLVFNWMLNYPELLDREHEVPALRVTSPVPSYWRANALDDFNGTAWLSRRSSEWQVWSGGSVDGRFTYELPRIDRVQEPGRAREPGAGEDGEAGAEQSGGGTEVTATFRIESISSDHFFTIGLPTRLVVAEPVSVHATQEQALRTDRPLRPGFEYTITAVVPEVSAQDLVGQGRDYPADARRHLGLPFPRLDELTERAATSGTGTDVVGATPRALWQETMTGVSLRREWQDLYDLNERIVTGASDPYQVALLIERHLRSGYAYTLSPPATGYQSPYAAFLFATQTGYCQHFAGAMAILLRFNGIPARVAVGFTTGGLVAEETYAVDTTNAHAWVEAYFPRSGWVTFDPTPGSSLPGTGASSSSVEFADPFPATTAGETEETADTAAAEREEARGALEDSSEAGAADGAASSGERPAWLVWASSLAAALVVWPFGRAGLRRWRARGTRRGDHGTRLRASLGLLRADLADHGVAVPDSDTLQETAQLLEERLGLDARDEASRAEAVLYGGREATAEDVASIAALRRELQRRLRARRSRLQTLAAAYGLRRRPRRLTGPGTRGAGARP